MSDTMIVGLETVSTYSTGEPVRARAASTAARSVGSTNSVVTPSPPSTRTSRSRVVPYTACVATIVWPALTDRNDGGVDGGHAGGEGEAGFGALQLGHGRAEGRGGGVVDPAVGVAGRGAGQDVAQLRRVAAREGGRLVDRDRRRNLIDLRASESRRGSRGS